MTLTPKAISIGGSKTGKKERLFEIPEFMGRSEEGAV
jgi:hypothetical protein